MDLFLQILDEALDALKDTGIVAVFLFGAFIVIGLLERGAGRKMVGVILAADKIGPLVGGFLGAAPSCGFSAAASNLYGAGVLTTGTLLAVYMATSDEMLAVMVSNLANGSANVLEILKILAVKVVSGIALGFLVDGVERLIWYIAERKSRVEEVDDEAEELADESYECGCNDPTCAAKGNLFASAVLRTLRIAGIIFAITLIINVVFIFVEPKAVTDFAGKYPLLGNLIASLFGLIPNCAVSVALTELYLDGVISASAMLCGLMTGAGSGLLVLFGRNKNMKENLAVVILLVIGGFGFGSLAGWLLF